MWFWPLFFNNNLLCGINRLYRCTYSCMGFHVNEIYVNLVLSKRPPTWPLFDKISHCEGTSCLRPERPLRERERERRHFMVGVNEGQASSLIKAANLYVNVKHVYETWLLDKSCCSMSEMNPFGSHVNSLYSTCGRTNWNKRCDYTLHETHFLWGNMVWDVIVIPTDTGHGWDAS